VGKSNFRYGVVLGLGMAAMGASFAQTVPNAPDAPTCTMKDGQSDCHFKAQMSGTPTSVVGNRVILFRKSNTGGHGTSRTYLDDAVKRLATRYNFTATITEDPTVFTASNLSNTKVVIMSNGDGDVVPAGANRTALQDFQQTNGWGVLWIHAACAFITSGWPFGQQSCVQQYYHHNPSGTSRKVFLDSGTTASPNHGIKNAQTEFVLRSLPGWNGARTFSMEDEYYCFQAPARNTAGVNVLLGYDRSSGLPVSGCPNQNDASATGSQNHNLAWTRMMGKGISLYNSIGHDEDTYKAGTNMGDSLLWRFIRYAAKDWEAGPVTGFVPEVKESFGNTIQGGSLSIAFANPARNVVTVTDVAGKQVFAKTYAGVDRAEIPGLQRGIYFVKVASNQKHEVKRVRIL
jgi:hypothetical protein